MNIVFLDSQTLGDGITLDTFLPLGNITEYKKTSKEEIEERISDADAIVTNKVKLYRESLQSAKHLKLICVTATGFDNIDLPYCKEKGIAVCNVKGYSTDCVTQLTTALVLNLITKIPSFSKYVKEGSYTKNGVANCLNPAFHEIAGKTWGIVGYGNIGKAVAKVAEALGCKILVVKRSKEEGVPVVDFETLCKESDIISFHVPLNDGTKCMLDDAHIEMLKKDVMIVNVARGAVIDEEAITNAILQDRIGGFATDVYSVEPFPMQHPFQKILHKDNVILTPHMAWGGLETRARLLEEVKQNMQAYLNGEIRNRVDL